ncbi:flavin monoamine oxidase family protein [Maricurvus nonylphenolicus]|uniref:flavin monoamine oxidase family protein n=1 Tax=Maricurvus nonylphenolicus TaxID=1008307 RepID=UPI0036F241D6
MAKENERVIVVGAGIAGLGAANSLQSSGYDVVLLEARDRIGGRIWTERSSGVAMDMGASWIHGIKKNPIAALAEKAKAPLSPIFDYDHASNYKSDGSGEGLPDKNAERFMSTMEDYLAWYLRREPNASLQTLIDDAQSEGDLDFLTSAQLNFMVNTEVEHEFAASPEKLSVEALDEGKSQKGGDVLFPQGYDAITDYLAQSLVIHTEAVVSKIKYDAKGVVVYSSAGEFRGDRVVVTVPLGVLKAGRIEFSPSLPDKKLQAIEKLGMGVLNKVWLTFPHVFWHRDIERNIIQYVSEEEGHFSEWLNGYKYVQQPVLLGFNAAEYGVTIESKSDQAITDEAMAVLRKIYGEDIPGPEAVKITRWRSDPYALGSYSYLKVGATTKHRKHLAEPVNNRLFFAGEATSSAYPATTQGAYLSGLREAERIRDL